MRYQFNLTGLRPILFHADDVERSDMVKEWRMDGDNKKNSPAGDDRHPAWTWQTYIYFDDEGYVTIPFDNMMACLRHAGAKIPTGKRQGTFKKESQSALLVEGNLKFAGPTGSIHREDLEAIKDLPFSKQAEHARKLGFDLFVKRATVGQAKHVRVRARFTEWTASGEVLVIDTATFPAERLKQLFEIAGAQSGLLDWRPSSKQSPGPFGTFQAKIKLIK